MIDLIIDHQTVTVEKGVNGLQLLRKREDFAHIYAIMLNGKLHDLSYPIQESGELLLIYDTSDTGKMIYERTLHFAFIAAVKLLYPEAKVFLEHALSDGVYCRVDKKVFLGPQDVKCIEQKMKELIEEKASIERLVVPTKEAVAFFDGIGMHDKASLLNCRKSKQSSIYTLCGIHDYFYGIMLPHTGYLTHFAVKYYAPGIWLSGSKELKDQQKLFQVFQEFERWGEMIHVSNIAELNQNILANRMDELVLMSETMVEKKLGMVADDIVNHHPQTKFILIAGPSSAGKTTFSKRLSIHLKILGKKPLAISMDDYYKNREDCPKLPDGNYDFDSLDALDLNLFNETMLKLMHKEPVRLPYFNFKTGLREWKNAETILEDDQILIIEGIHGLNPATSAYIPQEAKYKIYINALTHMNLDAHNRIPTSDYRLIRRLARDHQTRGWNARETISFWKNVRDNEDKYIYPFQEETDMIFNTSMVYELSILKKIVIPLLEEVPIEDKTYLEANRLKKLLEYFMDGDEKAIPNSSILAEFLGISIFDVA